MAAAEARSRWQRSANSFYAREDPFEASSFSYPSSSSLNSLSSESNHSPENALKEPHDIIPDYLSRFPTSSSPSGRRWWLNQEPNSVHNKNILRTHQVENLSTEFVNEERQLREGFTAKSGTESDGNCFFPHIGSGPDPKIHAFKAVTGGDSQKIGPGKDVRDVWFLDDHMMTDLDSPNSEESEKLASDFEYHCHKTEPWWRSTGKEDLASLVAQKSRESIENCDLPRPQVKTSYRKQLPVYSKSLDRDDALIYPMDRMVCKTGLSNLDHSSESRKGSSPLDSEQTSSGHSRAGTEEKGTETILESNETKAQLMRALCLSQKRAREAEEAAEQAYTEKEHIITLLFRQASQLLAYKQWLLLLQLENSVFSSSALPWMPCKPRQAKNDRHRSGRNSHGKPRHSFSKCAVAFALGLGLAGAGLLLGWTMGWLFPIA